MKRRDITLGEMQDECRRRNAFCEDMGACPYRDFCHETVGDKCGWGDKGPRDWNLTDPPRFTEAQMAFWKAWYAMGFIRASVLASGAFLFEALNAPDILIHNCAPLRGKLSMKIGDTLDLAELLGRDSADDPKP